MRNVPTMIQREVGAYFLSPIAYIVMAIFLLASGLADHAIGATFDMNAASYVH